MNLLPVSLGCDKNLADSEHMMAILRDAGFTIIDDENEADVIVINTCCFIYDAKQESIDTILEKARLKDNRLKALIVCGCLAERYRDEIIKEIPEVDAVVGTSSWDKIADIIAEVLRGNDTGEEQRSLHNFDEPERMPVSDRCRIRERCIMPSYAAGRTPPTRSRWSPLSRRSTWMRSVSWGTIGSGWTSWIT